MRSLLLLLLLVLAAAVVTLATAWDAQPDGYEVIDGPASLELTTQWRQDWEGWRRMELASNRYDAADACSAYNLPALAWTQRSLVQAMLLLHDRAIYDRQRDKYTVDAYVKQMEGRVGQLDSVLLWPAYPNIGIDSRNQWDLMRDLPGGLAGLKDLIEQFHARGIRVFLPYNPWDTATRVEDGLEDTVRMYLADIAMLNELVPALQADGFNGDTMYGVPSSFFNCSRPIVAAPEGGVPTAYLRNNPMSWGYLTGYAHFPPVARAKFLEPRHMVQVCARWSLDRLAELQTAFFNGAGYVVWENVWGIWNGMTTRESEATKRVFKVLRAFSFATTSLDWQPYFSGLQPARRLDGVFASEFPIDEGDGGWFYTVISTSAESKTVKLPVKKHLGKLGRVRVYDAYRGVELKQRKPGTDGVFVSFLLEPRGFGAVYVAPAGSTGEHPTPANLSQFLDEMRTLTAAPLSSFSSQRPLLQQKLIEGSDKVSTQLTALRRPVVVNASSSSGAVDSVSATTLENRDRKRMVRVRGADNWWFNVSGVQIEPVRAWTPEWPLYGTGVQFPWEHRPWNNHSVRLLVQDFFIDRYPVTNVEFARFLKESRYAPQSLDRFLEHWDNRVGDDSSRYKPLNEWKVPPSLEKSPVVNVAREDAEAFAAFYGKRLPHDWEWQYVASNGDKYTTYPWGNDYDGSRLPRVVRNGEEAPPLPEAVGSYPKAQSAAFGVDDLVGFVWQMTDRFCDDHTCGMLLRGGSYFRPVASTLGDPNWYFPQALQSQQHNRFLMLSQSYDRSPLVGFRCVKSARNSEDVGDY